MRRMAPAVPAVAGEATVASSIPSTSARAAVNDDDLPPVITRYDSTAYPTTSVTPPPTTAAASTRIVYNNPRPATSQGNGKVLLIRRNDGTTQYLRPVLANKDPAMRTFTIGGDGNPTAVRRVVAAVGGRPGAVVRTVGGPTRVVRVGPGGHQQVVNRVPAATRMLMARAIPATEQVVQPLRAVPQSQYAQEIPSGSVRIKGYRPIQRLVTRGGATMAMGQRLLQEEPPSIMTRPLKNPRDFAFKRGVMDYMRMPSYPSRPYRFDFESNEDEERAIAEAIAREEELMAQEEEENKQTQERQWNFPRIIDKFGQVRNDMLHQLNKQPLHYSSNLMPSKEDTEDEKQIKQALDCVITQVCRWDKQYGWFKNHQRKPRNNVEFERLKSKRAFSNQRELLLAEHVERLRREINKRRTKLENEAEVLCGMPTPWRKGKSKSKSKSRAKKPTAAARDTTPIVNPAEISLGGDAIDWMKKNIKEEDELIEDVSSANQPTMKRVKLEMGSPTRRKPPTVAKSDRVLRTRLNSHSSVEENKKVPEAPKKRGRPPKRPHPGDSEDSDGNGEDHGIPEGMTNPKDPHCICKKPYNSKRFYISCDVCSGWFHGKCVGIRSEDCEKMTSWMCPPCAEEATKAVDDKPLYCICKKPYDESLFYVGCDRCEDWFHLECVGITKEYAESIAEYMCPHCKAETEQEAADGYESTGSEASTSSNSPPLSRADYPKVWRLLETIEHHRMAWPFKEPIDPQKYPDYAEIVKKPMDLSTIQKKLERLEYIKLSHFSHDMNRMFENARKYNPRDSPIYLCATTLEKIFDQNLLELKREMANRMNVDRRKPSECQTIDSMMDIDTDQLIEVEGIDTAHFDISQYI